MKQTRIDARAEAVFAWHERPDAFRKLVPPWQKITVEQASSIRNGDRAIFRIHKGPLAIQWVAEHRDYIPDRQFRDVQIAGPFRRWEHTHRFIPDGQGCLLEDDIEYELPLGKLGEWFGGWLARRELERLFAYRHAVTLRDFKRSGDN